MGILSLLCFSIFTAIPGVICGHRALCRIKNSGGTMLGQGLAIGGLVTGYLGIAVAIFVIPLMLAIAIPNFVKARATAQRISCINNLRQIDGAKKSWALQNQKQASDTPTASDLAPFLMGGHLPQCPAGGDYKINAVGDNATCSIPTHEVP